MSGPATHSVDRFNRTVKDLSLLKSGRSPLAESLRVVADETTKSYRHALARALPAHAVHDSWRGDERDIGRLLWLHPLHVVDDATRDTPTAKQYGPVFNKTIEVAGGVFVPGIGWSAILAPRASQGVETCVRLTQRHWAYYSLYMQLDRSLLQTLNEARAFESAKRKDLQEAARDAFALYLRVVEARARLDSDLSSLGGDEQAIWDVIAKVQRFDTLVKGVERKLKAVQKLTERRADEAVDRRSRRISEGLTWLAAGTVLTVLFAAYAYFFGARDPVAAADAARLWAFVAALALAAIIVVVAYWERRIPKRRTDRPPSRSG